MQHAPTALPSSACSPAPSQPGRLPRAWPWEVGEDFLLATLATNSGMPHEAIDALWPGAAER